MPLKEVVKISFILLPYEDELPSVANPDGWVTFIFTLTLYPNRVLEMLG